MKKKSLKTIVTCLLAATVMLTLTSCSGGTKTISKYLTSKDRILAYTCIDGKEGIGKDTLLYDVFAFEKDQVTMYHLVPLDMGDIASMPDDELIEGCEGWCGEDDIIVYDTYRLVCYTDATGNNVYAEGIQVDDGNGEYEYIGDTDLFCIGSEYEVYDSEFTALIDPRYSWVIIAFKDAPTLELDNTDSKDVVIDP